MRYASLLFATCLIPSVIGCAHGLSGPADTVPVPVAPRSDPVTMPRAGSTATVPENMLVSVKNPDPLETRRGEFVYGDQCLVVEG